MDDDDATGHPSMADYDLYSWPGQFRGQFVRAVHAYAGKDWTEADGAAILS